MFGKLAYILARKTKQELSNKVSQSEFDQFKGDTETQLTQMTQKAHEVVTVGNNEDFETINEALEYLSKRHARFFAEGYTAEILLASGFGMEEQVFVDGIDLGWITISSEDEEVTINRASLTEDRFSHNSFPAFAVRRGSLPVINTLFNMNDTGTSTSRHGIFVLDNSKAKVSSGAGIKNSGGTGIIVLNSSKVTMINAIFLNSGQDGIRAQRSSVVNASGVDASNASNVGIHILDSSIADVQNSISNNSGICILANRSCIVNANGSSATGASQYGIRATQGSSINATLSNARVGSVDSQDDIQVLDGSIINAVSATGGTSQLVNEITKNGIIFR